MASASQCSSQEQEVADVKAAFPGRCRVIKDVGMFQHVVTLQPLNMDITLKFQLTETYPTCVPEVCVRSESLTEEQTEALKGVLRDRGQTMLHSPMLQPLVAAAEEWLRTQGVRPGKTVNAKAEVFLTGAGGGEKKKGGRKPKNRRKKKDEDEEGEVKKPSMKTAEDVIKRILWDERLDKDDFLVGYLDRFVGVVEKYFSAFSWEDIASVDYDVLAVPKHRIQYFKFRKQKIWDKPSRMDDVFGSTGSGKTIYDIIANYQDPSQNATAAEGSGQGSGQRSDQESAQGGATHDSAGSYSGDDDDDSDDDDDGITVTINSSVNTASVHHRLAGPGIDDDDIDDDVDENVGGHHNPYWRDKMRPTHFLCVRITDPEIRQGAEQIQDYILDNEPFYASCCVPPRALHVTLCTLGLDTGEQIAHAAAVLNRLRPELTSARPREPLRLQGVANFYSRVVYAKVTPHAQFAEFADHLRLLLREAGVEIRDNHDFVPHMTLMKVTRPVARQKGTKAVDPWLYTNFTDMDFGLQAVNTVHLCSMGDERREDGFYVCPAEIQLC